MPDPEFSKALSAYTLARLAEFDRIEPARRDALGALAAYVRENRGEEQAARLIFVCTHNSRRSQFGQVWAQAAAEWFGLGRVNAFSGGTEATVFDGRAVAALERAGFEVVSRGGEDNAPVFLRWGAGAAPLVCFSKVYDAPPNPRSGFAAVMTCASADQQCPAVMGADLRLAIRYDDPKAADGTPGESAAYDERCAQIAREMLYAFSLVR